MSENWRDGMRRTTRVALTRPALRAEAQRLLGVLEKFQAEGTGPDRHATGHLLRAQMLARQAQRVERELDDSTPPDSRRDVLRIAEEIEQIRASVNELQDRASET